MVVGLAFLVIADYQYMSSLYSRPQAMALTAASVLFVSFLGFLVLAIFKGKRKADTQIIHTLAKELEKPVQDNPGTAILIAMLAGMIFGRKI
jgi:ABC-type Fe3+ transport system permease subunit